MTLWNATARSTIGVERFDAVSFQMRAQFFQMRVISRLDRAAQILLRDVGAAERAIVRDLFNARAGRGDLRSEIRETAGTIADHGRESTKATIGDERAFDHAA